MLAAAMIVVMILIKCAFPGSTLGSLLTDLILLSKISVIWSLHVMELRNRQSK